MSYDRTGRPENFDIYKVINDLTGSTMSIDDAVESNYPGMEWTDLTTENPPYCLSAVIGRASHKT